jgi:hypothetical protein
MGSERFISFGCRASSHFPGTRAAAPYLAILSYSLSVRLAISMIFAFSRAVRSRVAVSDLSSLPIASEISNETAYLVTTGPDCPISAAYDTRKPLAKTPLPARPILTDLTSTTL